jgi:hypothetical protein
MLFCSARSRSISTADTDASAALKPRIRDELNP